jgi:hypothetical protein
MKDERIVSRVLVDIIEDTHDFQLRCAGVSIEYDIGEDEDIEDLWYPDDDGKDIPFKNEDEIKEFILLKRKDIPKDIEFVFKHMPHEDYRDD